MTVDEILAAGQYRDRRGREWITTGPGSKLGVAWAYYEEPFGVQCVISTHHLRLLIERDQHECDSLGLSCCNEHPVVSVLRNPDAGTWLVFDRFGIERVGPEYREWSDALADARALAVRE